MTRIDNLNPWRRPLARTGTVRVWALALSASLLPLAAALTAQTLPPEAPPPTLEAVACVDEDGQVEKMAPGQEIRLRPIGLQVFFSAPMLDLPGDGTPGGVSSVLSYRVLAAGPDQGLYTESCDEPDVDETEIPILEVRYDEVAHVSELTIDFGDVPDQEEGQFRLLVCSPDIMNERGTPLDGDQDGQGGDTAQFSFRLERRNHFVNGYFDRGFEGWIPEVGIAEDWTFAADVDADYASTSGAAELSNLTGLPRVGVEQCVAVEDWERLSFQSKILAAPGSDEPVILHSCSFFSERNCGGATLGEAESSQVAAEADEHWVTVESEIIPEPGTRSMRCSLSAQLDADSPTIAVDELSLSPLPMFSEDFEIGHFGRWSERFPIPE